MQLFVLFTDSNNLQVSGVTRPSSGAQEVCVQPRCRIQLSLIVSLLVACCICGGSWIGVRTHRSRTHQNFHRYSTAQHGRRKTAVMCRGLEKNGMVRTWHGHGMASVNQTRPHCVKQMGKTHSKPLTARRDRGTARARHEHGMLCVNRPLVFLLLRVTKY